MAIIATNELLANKYYMLERQWNIYTDQYINSESIVVCLSLAEEFPSNNGPITNTEEVSSIIKTVSVIYLHTDRHTYNYDWSYVCAT